MHSHGNPKGSEAEFFAAGQPCKIGEDNEGVSEDNLDGGRHLMGRRPRERVRRDDHRVYRFTLACSAELCAASASLAEIAAVSAGLPQLGASLPSPQARGR